MRVPNPFYCNSWTVEFASVKKQHHYKVLKWNESGTTQSLIKSGKYNGEKPKSLLTDLINGDAKMEAHN